MGAQHSGRLPTAAAAAVAAAAVARTAGPAMNAAGCTEQDPRWRNEAAGGCHIGAGSLGARTERPAGPVLSEGGCER